MVHKPTNAQQAKVTAASIAKFRKHKADLELTLACVDGLITELELVLAEYRTENGLEPGQVNG